MPYNKKKVDKKWQVVNSETGEVKGTHDTEKQANEQLAALYVNEPGLKKSLPAIPKQFLIPIQKYDAKTHMVYGWGAVEEPDHSGEILDYETSKPEMLKWSEGVSMRSGGKSKGNLREMHQEIAAGRLTELKPDDEHKAFYVAAEVVDPVSQEKVEKGVLNAFSIGGNYGRVWQDNTNPMYKRYTALPVELSLVDAPCAPTAIITMTKIDGVNEDVPMQPGEGKTFVRIVSFEEEPQKEEELEKVFPSSPMPISEIRLDSNPPSPTTEHVERLPDPNVTSEIKPDSIDGKALATQTVNTRDLTADLDAWMPKLESAMRKVIQEEIKKALPSVPAPARMIPVKSNFIKVRSNQ